VTDDALITPEPVQGAVTVDRAALMAAAQALHDLRSGINAGEQSSLYLITRGIEDVESDLVGLAGPGPDQEQWKP
jgi:hypothetical protein